MTLYNNILQRLPLAYYPYKPFMHKYNCIFIHIPKNAGTSILQVFNDKGGRKHAKWYDFYRASNYFYNHYFKFSVVREPLARVYSSYLYYVAGGNKKSEDIAIQQQIMANSDDFESFILKMLDADFLMLQLLFQPQYLYLFDRQLRCRVDAILRYENLKHDWGTLAKKQKYPHNLPWLNASHTDNKQVLQMLSSEAKTKVKSLYKFDYTLLGYASE